MSTKGLGFVIVGPHGGFVRGKQYGPNVLVWSTMLGGVSPCRTATAEEVKMWRRLQRLEKKKR